MLGLLAAVSDSMYIVLVLVIAAGLGLIPANIAKNKGYSFGLWWLYGWMLFIVAIIHVQFIPNLNEPDNNQQRYVPPAGSAEEIRKYKALLDDGMITQQEYDQKKKQLLGL